MSTEQQKAESRINWYHSKVSQLVVELDEEKKNARQQRWELMMEAKRKDEQIDVLNDVISKLLQHRYDEIDAKFEQSKDEA